MTRRRKIDDAKAAEMYRAGKTYQQIADYFDVTPVAVHYALERAGVERNHQNNPEHYSDHPDAVESRYYRAQGELAEALDRDDIEGAKAASAKVQREFKFMRSRSAGRYRDERAHNADERDDTA